MKIKFLFITFLSLFILTACQLRGGNDTESAPSITFTDPFNQVSNLEEVEERTGFSITLPEEIEGYHQNLIEAMDEKMVQIYYNDDSENQIVIRKAVLAEGIEDISGDTAEYDSEIAQEVNINEEVEDDDEDAILMTVNLKGSDRVYYLAYWTRDNHLYSLYSNVGLYESDMINLAKEIQ